MRLPPIPLIDRPDALAQAHNELGVALSDGTKNQVEAEAAFRKALELGPPSPGTVRANLAAVLLRSGRHAEALELAREALSFGPRYIQVCKGADEGFDHAVREALSHWAFKPATVDGKPVSVYYTITTTRTALR